MGPRRHEFPLQSHARTFDSITYLSRPRTRLECLHDLLPLNASHEIQFIQITCLLSWAFRPTDTGSSDPRTQTLNLRPPQHIAIFRHVYFSPYTTIPTFRWEIASTHHILSQSRRRTSNNHLARRLTRRISQWRHFTVGSFDVMCIDYLGNTMPRIHSEFS